MTIVDIKRSIRRRQCQVEGCQNSVKYALFKTFPNGDKKWLYVCPFHEGEIGYENHRRAGGYYQRSKNETLPK